MTNVGVHATTLYIFKSCGFCSNLVGIYANCPITRDMITYSSNLVFLRQMAWFVFFQKKTTRAYISTLRAAARIDFLSSKFKGEIPKNLTGCTPVEDSIAVIYELRMFPPTNYGIEAKERRQNNFTAGKLLFFAQIIKEVKKLWWQKEFSHQRSLGS